MVAIIFDLDGTLVDSAPDLLAAANRMLAGEDMPPLDLPTLTRFIGNGVPKLVERIMAARGLDPADHDRLLGVFMAFYTAEPAVHTRPYPGVIAALETLAAGGHSLGICTNKPELPAREILEQLGLARFFGAVVGGDTLEVKKPDPAPLCHAVRTLDASRTIYVGDSETDAETAIAADVPFLLFTEGYRKSAVAEIVHLERFAHFSQLPAIVGRLE